MFGLAVRWSLVDCSDEVLPTLRDYVAEESYSVFEQLAGLRFKTWRAREGEWFEGVYVFVSAQARADFQDDFAPRVAQSKGSTITGAGPISIEPFEVIAVAEGPEGFLGAPRFEH